MLCTLSRVIIDPHNQSFVPCSADRVTEAFTEMGVTVFGGAITSLGASAMLFLCYFQTFFKFGGFMFLTIMMSFIWSNLFFMSVLATVGPNGDTCSFKPMVDRCASPTPVLPPPGPVL